MRRGSRAAMAWSWVITSDGGTGGVELFEQLDDRFAGGAVEVAGGFVGQHDRRPADQGAGDGDPLPLAAGQLGGSGARAGRPGRPGGSGFGGLGAALGDADAGVEQAVGDVVQHGGVFGEEELLEHEPDAGGAQRGQLPVGQVRHVQPGDVDAAGGGPVQGTQHLQQGGLTGPGRADDGDQLTRIDGETHAAQRDHGRLARVAPGHLLDLQHRAHEAGTTTCCPAARPDPVTCTSPVASSNSPACTGTRWRVPSGSATSTAYPPPDWASSACHRHRQRIVDGGGGDRHQNRGLVQGAGGRRIGGLDRDRHGRRGVAGTARVFRRGGGDRAHRGDRARGVVVVGQGDGDLVAGLDLGLQVGGRARRSRSAWSNWLAVPARSRVRPDRLQRGHPGGGRQKHHLTRIEFAALLHPEVLLQLLHPGLGGPVELGPRPTSTLALRT